jgi:hypothetical protein
MDGGHPGTEEYTSDGGHLASEYRQQQGSATFRGWHASKPDIGTEALKGT